MHPGQLLVRMRIGVSASLRRWPDRMSGRRPPGDERRAHGGSTVRGAACRCGRRVTGSRPPVFLAGGLKSIYDIVLPMVSGVPIDTQQSEGNVSSLTFDATNGPRLSECHRDAQVVAKSPPKPIVQRSVHARSALNRPPPPAPPLSAHQRSALRPGRGRVIPQPEQRCHASGGTTHTCVEMLGFRQIWDSFVIVHDAAPAEAGRGSPFPCSIADVVEEQLVRPITAL